MITLDGGRLSFRIRLAWLAAALVTVTGCGTGTGDGARSGGVNQPDGQDWTAPAIDLPAGTRQAIYDRPRDIIWILTRARGAGPISITQVRASDNVSSTKTLATDSLDYQGAGIALDKSGDVWVGWGDSVTRIAPSNWNVTHWQLPSVDPIDSVPDEPSIGRVVALSIDPSTDRPVVLRLGDPHVYLLRGDAWESQPSKLPVLPGQFSTIAFWGDGMVGLTGNLSRPDPVPAWAAGSASTWALVSHEGIVRMSESRDGSTIPILRDT
jgi:hypothetical protein